MNKFFCILIPLVTYFLSTSYLHGEPVDKNESGMNIAGGLQFGQSANAGNGSPGPAWYLFVEPGYGFAADTWNRIEGSVEIGTGQQKFSRKVAGSNLKQTHNITGQVILKGGYGYSLGNHAFALWKIGAGTGFGDLSTDNSALKDESTSSVIGQIGMDVVLPAGDKTFVVAGGHLRIHTVSPSDQDTFQLNIPYLGLSLRRLL